jgi:hypothetical protein
MMATSADSSEWLAGCARARAKACRSSASAELDMPAEMLAIRQAHKQHVARLFDGMADQLENGFTIADIPAALDLIYEPNICGITGLTRAEDLALRALGLGISDRFNVPS